MKADLHWVEQSWPREVTSTQGLAALLALNGISSTSRRDVLVLRAVGRSSGVSHFLGVGRQRQAGRIEQLQTAIPGLTLVDLPEAPAVSVDRAWQAWQNTAARPLKMKEPEALNRGLLTALAHVRGSEELVADWWLGRVRRPKAVGSKVNGSLGPTFLAALLKAPFIPPSDLDTESRSALRSKVGLPGWRACLRVGVKASGTARQRQLLGGLASAVRVAAGPSSELGFHGLRPAAVSEIQLPYRWRLLVNAAELLGLTAWPLGETEHLPVKRVRSRLLPPSRALVTTGHVIGEATYPGSERPVAISINDSRMHTHLVGKTGSGKSNLLLHCIVQDMEANRSVVVIDPKADLIQDVLARVPERRLDDVVIIDPTSDTLTGLNPLAQPGVPPELIADQVLAVFKGLYADAWGPRTQDILTAGLLTLAHAPGMSLVALPTLFTNVCFRNRLLRAHPDRLGVGPFWAWWDGLSSAEQNAVLAAPMNKLRQLVIREKLRRVVGQVNPKFDLREVYSRRRIVLFDLKKGALGPESSALLGSLAVSMVWQAALGRAAIPPEKRHAVFVYVDEFADYVNLPQDFSDVLSQARSLGVGMFLAHQFALQTRSELRAAIQANARSRILFTVSPEDAALFVKTDRRLTPEDVTSLRSFEAYASLTSGNEPQPFVSIRTLPPPPTVRDPEEVRQRSAQRWGRPAAEIDATLEALVGDDDRPSRQRPGGKQPPDDGPFGVRPRRRSPKPGEGEPS